MKKLIIVFVGVIISIYLVGCAAMLFGTKYSYSYKLVKPESTDMKWEDDKIAFTFFIGDKEVNFKAKNKTNEVMKIIWDEATLVQFGKAKKVMHSGVKYTDRNSSQPASTIPSGASIDDLMMPTDNVYFSSGQYGGWREQDLFPTQDLNEDKYKQSILNSKGQKFSVYIPVQYQGKTLDYTFEFEITDVQPLAK